jgi:hypothetical protein
MSLPPRTTGVFEQDGDSAAMMVVLAVTTHLLLPWLLGHMPYQDIANHIARYALMDRAWSGSGPAWIQVRLVSSPYIAVDILGAGLVHLLGPHAAERVLTTVALGLLPLGTWLLVRAAAPGASRWTMAAVLLSCSPFLLKGLLNYQIGVGAALVWIALWWPTRAGAGVPVLLGLTAGMAVLFLIHPFAGGTALLLLGVDLGLQLFPGFRAFPSRAEWTRARGRLRICLACGTVAALMVWETQRLGTAPGSGGTAVGFRSILSKLAELSEPFYTFTPWEMALTVVGYGAAVAAVRGTRVLGRAGGTFGLAAASLGLLYLITPERIGGASHLDVRWLIPGLLLVGITETGTPGRRERAATNVLFACCLLHAGLVLHFGRRIDRDLDDFDAVRHHLPTDARILALVGGPPRYGRVEPYLHYALWQTSETGARVGGLFSATVVPLGEAAIVAPQFGHFREMEPSIALFGRWRNAGEPGLPWPVVDRQYDYIVQAGADSALSAMISGGACLTERRGGIFLYRVGPCLRDGRTMPLPP